MSDYFIYVLIAIIVIVGVWFIFAKVLKNKKPKEVTLKDIPIDLEALIHALGGIDNIKESQSQGSKVRFFVENDDLVKVNVLKELGASGVIQATGKVTVILGKFSDEISRIVNEKKIGSEVGSQKTTVCHGIDTYLLSLVIEILGRERTGAVLLHKRLH